MERKRKKSRANSPWRVARWIGYLQAITEKPRRSDELETVRRSPELDRYIGEWVATKGGHVIAHASTSGALVEQVLALGDAGADAIAEYVAPPSSTWMVGVG